MIPTAPALRRPMKLGGLRLVWTPSGPGGHRLVVRTYEGAGTPQVDKDRTSGPEGATGLHKIMAQVA